MEGRGGRVQCRKEYGETILWQYLAVNKSKGEYSAPVFKIGYHSLFGGMKFK